MKKLNGLPTKYLPQNFPVVGIGASAGGLEAIQTFFDHMPFDTEMAFVIVQHLSPDFKSLMKELLQKHTNIPVNTVEKYMLIQPNNIYLLPPKKNIIIENGYLKLLEKDPTERLNLPIDLFFHSLGEHKKEYAVGIVLSGTGTDGSRGLKTIKEKEGLIMIQDPITAKFDGMPNAAIFAGMADYILSPANLAKELSRIFKHNSTTKYLHDKQLLSSIIEKILYYSGINFKYYRQPTIVRRITKRINILNFQSLQSYSQYLSDNSSEIEILYKEFLIGVTHFFRDLEAFNIVQEKVIPNLFKNRKEENVIRIWIAGCSTGEEVYSFAILFSEYINKHKLVCDFKIFASDINKDAIQWASKGIYNRTIEKDISPHRLSTFFAPYNDGFQVKENLRNKIVFAVHDITADPPFIKMDFVSCRNLLIYFTPYMQRKILTNFHFSLNTNAYLFLGASESIGTLSHVFTPISKKWNIFKNVLTTKMSTNHFLKPPAAKYLTGTKNTPLELPGKVASENAMKKEEELYTNLLLEEYTPICLFVNQHFDILYTNGPIEELFFFPKQTEKFNLLNMVAHKEQIIFRNCLQNVLNEKKTFFYKDVAFTKRNRNFILDLKFKPFWVKKFKDYAILIEIVIKTNVTPVEVMREGNIEVDSFMAERLEMLELELRENKQEVQNLVEQLETANEELQTSNEELLASNEELQSTNEELQSVNEELYTVNTELQYKINETSSLNDDLNNILVSTNIGVIFLDTNLLVRKLTPAVKKQFNLQEQDIGRSITHFTHNLSYSNLIEDVKSVLDNLEIIDKKILTSDDDTYLMRILPYRTHEDAVAGIVITFIDIGTLQKKENELKSQKELLNSIIECVGDGIIAADKMGLPILVNEQAKKILQFTEENLHTWEQEFKIYYDDEETLFPREKLPLIRATKGESVNDVDLFICNVKNTNNFMRINCSSRPLKSLKNDETIGGVIVFKDTTQDVVIKRALKKNEKKFQALFNRSFQYSGLLSKKGYILEINKPALTLLQCESKEELKSKHFWELLPGKIDGHVTLQLKNVLKIVNEGELVRSEIDFINNGSKITLDISLKPIFSDKKNVELILVEARDITEIIEASKKIEELNKSLETKVKQRTHELEELNTVLQQTNNSLDNLVHSIAHDLRSPILNLKSFTQLMDRVESKEQKKLVVTQIHSAVNRLEKTLNGLIEMIDFQGNEYKIKQELNFNDILKEVINILNYNLTKQNITISSNFLAQSTVVYVKPHLISILQNLISNAVKYQSPNRSLQLMISTQKVENFILLSVKDNGIGMDLEKYGDLLFKPFKRLTTEGDGNGIGLSIVKSAVTSNGGHVKVESTIDKGTTFFVYLKPYVS